MFSVRVSTRDLVLGVEGIPSPTKGLRRTLFSLL